MLEHLPRVSLPSLQVLGSVEAVLGGNAALDGIAADGRVRFRRSYGSAGKPRGDHGAMAIRERDHSAGFVASATRSITMVSLGRGGAGGRRARTGFTTRNIEASPLAPALCGRQCCMDRPEYKAGNRPEARLFGCIILAEYNVARPASESTSDGGILAASAAPSSSGSPAGDVAARIAAEPLDEERMLSALESLRSPGRLVVSLSDCDWNSSESSKSSHSSSSSSANPSIPTVIELPTYPREKRGVVTS